MIRAKARARAKDQWKVAPPFNPFIGLWPSPSPSPLRPAGPEFHTRGMQRPHSRRTMEGRKRLIVVGDRVLIAPQEGDDRSRVGLYLPATAVDNQAVQTGTVVATGPGTPISAPTELGDEPWKMGSDLGGEPRYMPMQARVGDFAIFFRRAAVEITFENNKYLVVPQ